jgi:hypothetical protein
MQHEIIGMLMEHLSGRLSEEDLLSLQLYIR